MIEIIMDLIEYIYNIEDAYWVKLGLQGLNYYKIIIVVLVYILKINYLNINIG